MRKDMTEVKVRGLTRIWRKAVLVGNRSGKSFNDEGGKIPVTSERLSVLARFSLSLHPNFLQSQKTALNCVYYA